VAVDADRKNGIEQLLSQVLKPEVILLDDPAPKSKGWFYIYSRPLICIRMISCFPQELREVEEEQKEP
jgi:hypothetical protein